jgi:hypothetical protein
LANARALARHLLLLRQHGLRFSQVDDYAMLFHSLNGAIEHLALAIGELFVNEVALCFLNPLQNSLFGGLGCDTPEVGRRYLDFDDFVEAGVVGYACASFNEI